MLALDGEGVLYAAIDNSATRRVVIKEYVPVTICAARSRDGSVIPRQGREVLFKTTRMDFVDLYRSLVALGRNDGLVQVLDLIEKTIPLTLCASRTRARRCSLIWSSGPSR